MSFILNPLSSVIPIGGVASIAADSGSAVPVVGVINIVGAGGITTSAAGSTVTITAGASLNYTVVNVSTSPYVALSTDQVISVDSTGGARTVQLPNAPATGRWFTVKDSAGTAGTNNITVTTVGGVVLLDGAATFVMNSAYQSATVIFNGTKYLII